MLINRERTASHLQELGVEAAILSGGPNFNYAAGWGSDAHLWGGGPFAIVPSDEAGEITLIIANHELPFVWRDPDFKPALRTVGREVEPCRRPRTTSRCPRKSATSPRSRRAARRTTKTGWRRWATRSPTWASPMPTWASTTCVWRSSSNARAPSRAATWT